MFKATLGGGTYWFTCALAIAEFIALILLLLRKNTIWLFVIIGILLSIISNVIANNNILVWNSPSLPWSYKSGLIATLFLAIGGVYSQKEKKIDAFFSKYRLLYMLALFLVAVSITIWKYNLVECCITRGNLNVMGFIVIIVETYAILRFCKLMKKSGIINWIGRHSLGLYFLCGAIPNIIGIVMLKYGLPLNIMTVGFASIVSFSFSIVVCWTLYRFIPFAYDFGRLFKAKSVS